MDKEEIRNKLNTPLSVEETLHLLEKVYPLYKNDPFMEEVLLQVLDHQSFFPVMFIQTMFSCGRHYLKTLLEKIIDIPNFTRQEGSERKILLNGFIDHHFSLSPHGRHRLPGIAGAQDFWQHNQNLVKQIFYYRDPRQSFISAYKFFCHADPDRYPCSPLSLNNGLIDFLHNGWGIHPWNFYMIEIKQCYDDLAFLNLSYESLIFKPTQTLEHLIQFTHYPLDITKINNALASTKRTGSLNSWIHYFNDEIEAEFKKHAGDIVSYLGYEADENWSYKDYAHLNKDTMTEREYWLAKPRPIFTLPPENA